MGNIDFNLLRDKAYKIAKDHGFHEKELSDEHCLVLVVSELSEALEAYRKGRCLYENRDVYNEEKEKVNNRLDKNDILAFDFVFGNKIKDTFEDELADTVIRLLDLAGYKGYEIPYKEYMKVYIKNKSVPEHIFIIISTIVSTDFLLKDRIGYCIRYIFELSGKMGIDILWHIETKMRYNELRSYKHGKKF